MLLERPGSRTLVDLSPALREREARALPFLLSERDGFLLFIAMNGRCTPKKSLIELVTRPGPWHNFNFVCSRVSSLLRRKASDAPLRCGAHRQHVPLGGANGLLV